MGSCTAVPSWSLLRVATLCFPVPVPRSFMYSPSYNWQCAQPSSITAAALAHYPPLLPPGMTHFLQHKLHLIAIDQGMRAIWKSHLNGHTPTLDESPGMRWRCDLISLACHVGYYGTYNRSGHTFRRSKQRLHASRVQCSVVQRVCLPVSSPQPTGLAGTLTKVSHPSPHRLTTPSSAPCPK